MTTFSNIKRVLIIKTSSLGDIVHALPVLDYLHKVSPGIAIDWVVEEQFSELLSGNPLISNLHVVRTRRWRHRPLAIETMREVMTFRKELRSQCYDLVFDIQGNLKSGIIARATGVRQSIGFSSEYLQEAINYLLIRRQIPQRKQDDYAGGRYLRIVSVPFGKDYLGMKLSTDIPTGPNEEAVAEALIKSCGIGPVFLLHSGTTWQTKFWTEEGWASLGQRIDASFPGSTMLLSWGNESERSAAVRIAAAIGSAARLLDKYSLKGITAIIKKVDIVIGGDTGLIHLAAAVGTPTASYYRASDGSVSGPRGQKHIVVQSSLACTRCHRTTCKKDAECRGSITVDSMYEAVVKLIG